MKNLFILLALTFTLSGCLTDSDGAVEVLEAQGFTNIQTHGYAFFACSEDDTFATKFTATGPTGKPASGAVCCGLLFKNCTVRF